LCIQSPVGCGRLASAETYRRRPSARRSIVALPVLLSFDWVLNVDKALWMLGVPTVGAVQPPFVTQAWPDLLLVPPRHQVDGVTLRKN
jgi:hypothetical protein